MSVFSKRLGLRCVDLGMDKKEIPSVITNDIASVVTQLELMIDTSNREYVLEQYDVIIEPYKASEDYYMDFDTYLDEVEKLLGIFRLLSSNAVSSKVSVDPVFAILLHKDLTDTKFDELTSRGQVSSIVENVYSFCILYADLVVSLETFLVSDFIEVFRSSEELEMTQEDIEIAEEVAKEVDDEVLGNFRRELLTVEDVDIILTSTLDT